MRQILFLSAPLVSRIWGGSYFNEVLHLTDKNDIGEMWSLSAIKGSESIILDGEYKGLTLREVYEKYPLLFGNPKEEEFPILVKIIATSDDLSVQVHPNDEYAKRVENQFGKTEGWLILDAKEGSSIVLGHNAKTKEELVSLVNENKFDELLAKREVKVGEFYPIPAGTIHALGKNIVLVEVQQSSTVTYRFYDYDRVQKDGSKRELHIAKAIDVTDINPYSLPIYNCYKDSIKTIWRNEYFEVNLFDVNNKLALDDIKSYLIVTVIDGAVNVNDKSLKQGDSFIICAGEGSVNLSGNGKIITTEYLK